VNSIKKNIFLNLIKVTLSILFPLVTFPYISRLFGPEGLGELNFVDSIVSYFRLFSNLGINTYAITYGSKIRDDKTKLGIFISEIFSINILTSLISFIFLLFFLFSSDSSDYSRLILVDSLSFLFAPIGIIWLFNILEDFKYITIRYIFIQISTIVLILLFVKNPTDVLLYIVIIFLSNLISYLINFFYGRNRISFGFSFKHLKSFKNHYKPLLTIFVISFASTIYLNSDITFLGYIHSEYEVGLYTASIKINKLILIVISSLNTVLIPRLAYLIEKNNKKEFNYYINKAINLLLFLMIPSAIFLFIYSEQIIYIFSGINYLEAVPMMRILSINLLFSLLNGFLAYQILIPFKKESVVMISTLIGAVLNLSLNVIFIPRYGAIGAASTTLFAEISVFIFLFSFSNRKFQTKPIFYNVFYFLFSAIPLIFYNFFLFEYLAYGDLINLVIIFLISFSSYFLILYFFKNETITYIVLQLHKLTKLNKEK
jgi:O-antigen/teichoic acid export membrane protein